MKKAVFFDIDGTLWDAHNHIPPSTKTAIGRLRERGHLTFLNSGRCRSFIRDKELLALGFDGIVSGCGTRIEYHDEVLFYHRMDNALAEKTIRTVRSFGFRPILEGVRHLYMDEAEFGFEPYGDKLKRDMGEDLVTISDHWGRWEISKLSCATTDCDIDGCYEALKSDFDFMVHNPDVVEIVPKGFDKGSGIRRVCELLGLLPEDTYAIGDSINDKEMLEAAGTAIAMGNGTDAVKSIADYVTAPMLEDGIYQALTYYGLI